MKGFRRLLSVMLAVAMVLTTNLSTAAAPVTGENAEAAKEYKLYPIPRFTEYTGKEFAMTDSVTVVYEKGIDEATKNFLQEVLTDYGKKAVPADQINEKGTTILLGTEGSKGAADDYVSKNVTVKNTKLFEQTDPYVLSAKDNVIVILGKDTDSAFYGVATLQMMLTSFAKNEKLLEVQIEDYAGMEFRGFVEGFYGGWDYPSRESLMRFGRDVKMNTYVYASKNDPYHRNKWNELYPQEELDKIADLVKVGEETKCYYAWSVHMEHIFKGENANLTEDQRYEMLTKKFDQLYKVGVRKFDILNDDFGSGTNEQVVSLINRLVKGFIEPKGCEPLTYCMKGYNKAWSGDGTELEAMKKLDPSVSLYWTGDDVNSPITQATVDFVKEKTGHEACYWLNYPVNEHAKSGIYLGDITHYARDGVTGLKGAVSNPSRFAESNKVGLFQLACLFWNNTDYQAKAKTIWEDAFRYLQPEVQDAYFIIASNVANCPGSGRVPQGFPESEYLKKSLDSVLAKVNAGQKLDADPEFTGLIASFGEILKSVEDFKKNCENAALVAELTPWLNSLQDIAEGGVAVLKCVDALQKKDVNTAWEQFAVAAKALETWNTYPTVAGDSNMAEAGSKRLQPFVAKMTVWAKNNLTPLMDPGNTEVNPTFYAQLGGAVQTDSAASEKIFDGDLTTYGEWNVVQKEGDYYGVDFGRVIPVKDITIVQGKLDADHDRFHNFNLEYSADGKTWTTIESYTEDQNPVRIEKEGLTIEARYVRLKLTKVGTDINNNKTDYWTHVREFTVNKKTPTGDRIYTNVEQLKRTPLTEQGKEYSVRDLKNLTLAAGQYVGIKLLDAACVTDISLKGSGLDALTAEYSLNGMEWTAAKKLSAPAGMKYLRLANHTQESVTCDLTKLGMTFASREIDPAMSETSFTNAPKEGRWENMFDGDLSTFVWTNEGQEKDDYIIVDLGAVTPVYDVTVATNDGKPRLYEADLQVSANKKEWKTIASVKGDSTVVEPPCRYVRGNAEGMDARYIRILITDNVAGKYDNPFLKIHEIEINKSVPSDDAFAEISASIGGDLSKAVDGDISTVLTTTDKKAGWLEYQMTENTKLAGISILQDAKEISGAAVKVRTGAETYAEVGTLDQAAKTFDLKAYDNVYAVRIEWTEGKVPSIYEIFTEEKANDSDDIGEYTEHIIVEDGGETGPQEPENLALRKPVEVSGTEANGGAKDRANDGDTNTWWDSNHIKGANANPPAWIYVDLGADKVSTITEIRATYNNKVYPTDYDIQIADALSDPASEDDWTTVKTIKKADNGPTHPTDTEVFEKPITARYVRLYFRSLNSAAAGNGIGLKELEVMGTQSDADQGTEEAKNALKEVIDTVEKTDVSVYTNATVAVLNEKLVAAKTAYESAKDEKELSDAQAGLEEAIEGLQVKITAEAENLALGQKVEVSGTSNGGKESLVDGNADTKWDSAYNISKGDTVKDGNEWVSIDLGEGTALIDQISVSYFNLVFPTDYEIMISADGENWTAIDRRGYEDGGAAHPTDVISFAVPVAAEHLKFVFHDLNASAAGNGVGINEIEVMGRRLYEDADVLNVKKPADIRLEKGVTADELLEQLPLLIETETGVIATPESTGYLEEKLSVCLPVDWDLAGFDGAEDKNLVITGAVESMGAIASDKTTTVNVTVGEPQEPAEPVMTEIKIAKAPSKTEYEHGEELDLSGLEVTAVYSDGSEKTLTADEYTVRGFDPETAGEKTVTVTCGGFKATFTVTVKEKEEPAEPVMTEIKIAKAPSKTEYEHGEELDLSGLEVTAVYSDGSEKALTADEYTVRGFDSEIAGEKTVTVTCGGFTATFTVTVKEKEESEQPVRLTGIRIKNKPSKTEYKLGEKLDLAGLEIEAVYSDGSAKPITSGYTVNGFDSQRSGEQTITIVYKDLNATFKVTVAEAQTPQEPEEPQMPTEPQTPVQPDNGQPNAGAGAETPKTGDLTNAAAVLFLFAASAAALLVFARKRRIY